MQQDDSNFPIDVAEDHPSPRPWNFPPEGYLVVILADPDEAQRAETALVRKGFAPRDIKSYTDEQILEHHELSMGRRTALSKAVGAVADDVEGRSLYLAYGREGRCGCGCASRIGSRSQGSPSARRLRLPSRALLRARRATRLPRHLTGVRGALPASINLTNRVV